MKKVMLTILTMTLTMTMVMGCSKKQPEQEIGNTTKVEEQIKEEPVSKKLEKLQPGVFKSELAEAITKYESIPYDELARYTSDYIDDKVEIIVRINTISENEEGYMELYGYDYDNNLYFIYYDPNKITANVIKDDIVHIYGRVHDSFQVTSTNGFGAQSEEIVPGIELEYMLDNYYENSYKALTEYLGNEGFIYIPEFVAESKDFKELVDIGIKRGYVFALKDKSTGEYLDKYIVAENGILRYYQPTIDGLNINGEAYDFKNEKALWGAQ